jgi:hypothetical protein
MQSIVRMIYLTLSYYLFLASSFETTSYVRVERRTLNGGASVTSLFPAGWLTRALKEGKNSQTDAFRLNLKQYFEVAMRIFMSR